MELTIGTFVFLAGEHLALEVVRDEDCFCMCDPIQVLELSLENADGSVLFKLISDSEFPTLIDEWTGMLALATPEGQLLPSGEYTVVVRTSAGNLSALLHIMEAGEPRPTGRVSSMASICGIELRLYRLLTEQTERSIGLRVGDQLMTALEGNATTGYSWELVNQEVPDILIPLPGRDYQPSPSPVGIVGSGGRFLFRYKADSVGKAELTFVYRRPWEAESDVEAMTFEVTVW
jgi:inhibitor of cysteine peptidase